LAQILLSLKCVLLKALLLYLRKQNYYNLAVYSNDFRNKAESLK